MVTAPPRLALLTIPRRLALLLITVAGFELWRSQLFIVSNLSGRPQALIPIEAASRDPASIDVILPAVPFGAEQIEGGNGVLIVHYWAPWERHGASQAAALDSLDRLIEPRPRIAMVCFDPFPSLARYVARERLRLAVLLDHDHKLRAALPCPSVPYTYVIDRQSRIAVEQAGEIDWLSPATREALRALLAEPERAPARPVRV
ncbi:MAG: hypothetical protein HYR73_08310 [Candidatus Eisenbacteria bacterium]|nr:hypothetical protein [Candidatus Eisenbacteria bacterium]